MLNFTPHTPQPLANAEPGMLVQRAFREGAAVQNSEKATMIGVLLGRVSAVQRYRSDVIRGCQDHTSYPLFNRQPPLHYQVAPNVWNVRWPDATVRPYKTGHRGQFQLCFAQTHMAVSCRASNTWGAAR